MSKTETSKVKAKNTTIWIMTVRFSRYKDDDDLFYSRCFVSKQLALSAMEREARRLYKSSEIIQEADDKYFDRCATIIEFGENPESSDYRREFGFCKIESAKLEDEESGNDVPSSEDDESDDE